MSDGASVQQQRWIDAAEAGAFATDVLLSATRTRPVVAITTNRRLGGPTLDPDELAREIGDRADVVVFETGDATWALSDALPNRLDVYGGAARIWWPGLSAASDPYEHPLLIFDASQTIVMMQRIIAAIRNGDARAGRHGPWQPPADASAYTSSPASTPPLSFDVAAEAPRTFTKAGKLVQSAKITRIEHGRVYLRVSDTDGILGFADEKLDNLAARLVVGQMISVFMASTGSDGTPRFSTQGLLRRSDAAVSLALTEGDLAEGKLPHATPLAGPLRVRAPISTRGPVADPWKRIDEEYRVGDVVRGRVCSIKDRYVLIEVLPGAAFVAPIGELDQGFVRHPSDVVRMWERVNVEILRLDTVARRGEVSIKRAGMSEPLPAIALGPGKPLFLADDWDETESSDDRDDRELGQRAAQLLEELESALADRAELMKRLKAANEQVTELRKELRGTEGRLRAFEARVAGDLDPTMSETAFLTAVRLEYARRFNESDRLLYPLQRMRVGREFLERLRQLNGISAEKVVEVCAQVACLRASEVVAREVHELRNGEGGAPAWVRDRDGAKAWRCSLQVNTASARRLHWWDIPGKDGRTIEFASVAVHDDFSIP